MPVKNAESVYAVRYGRWTQWLRRHPRGCSLLRAVNTGLTFVFYGAYGALLVWVLIGQQSPLRAACLVVVPAVAFVLVSWYRRHFDAPRPYECCSIEPLVSRDGAGRSFPSRHAFSAFTIATCWFAASAPLAGLLLVAAAALACCRVLGGVHFPRDVVAGAVIGVIAGMAACLAYRLL